MLQRKCLNCGGAIDKNKRSDAKFCGSICRSAFWEKSNSGALTGLENLSLKKGAEQNLQKDQERKPEDNPNNALKNLKGIVEPDKTNSRSGNKTVDMDLGMATDY